MNNFLDPLYDTQGIPTTSTGGSIRFSSILDDQPAEADLLDFSSYTDALLELITNPSTKTPLTLGIFGRWGTGKTTLMRMLEKGLEQKQINTVWFNAWQYSKEDELWAAFLQSVLNKLEGDFSFWEKVRFKFRLFFKRLSWSQLPEGLLKYLFRAILVALPLLLINPASGQLAPVGQALVRVGGTATTLALAGWIVVRPLWESIQQHVSIDFNNFRQQSDYQKHIAFLDKFRDHFADIIKSLPIRGDKRLAVFIDDLDRCSQDRILQVLDAIKLFIDIPGCLYVIGLDTDIVEKAVAEKYKDDKTAQKEYLSKIVQLPFQLPPLTRTELGGFLDNLQLELPDIRCREVFTVGLVVNPREVKRTVNIFSLLWNLSSKRAELMERIQPVLLAKTVVIQHGYPELHKLLQQKPHLLRELETYCRQEQERQLKRENGLTLPAELTSQLNEVLMQCGAFESYDQLRTVFETESLSAWRDSLPYSDSSEALIPQTIEFLQNRFDESEHSALVLFLNALKGLQEGDTKGWLEKLKLINSAINRYFYEERILSRNEVSSELKPFILSESLRHMLLLFELTEHGEQLNFANLDPEEIEAYFTLTNRAETPGADDIVSTSSNNEIFLGDRYRIFEMLGRGGMSTVYLAHDSRQDQRVAIKILDPTLTQSTDLVRRFEEEIRMLYRLDHPNIVRIYDNGIYQGRLFYTMQYLSGGSLRDLLNIKGSLSARDTIAILIPILEALGLIHQQGIIHRDIKPGSIMFDAQNVPKLTDFNIAKVPAAKYTISRTRTQDIIGTIAYMAPEQFMGGSINITADLYSLGVTLYECLSGNRPHQGDIGRIVAQRMNESAPSLLDVKPDLNPEIVGIVQKLMDKDPENRFQTAEEVKQALLTIK